MHDIGEKLDMYQFGTPAIGYCLDRIDEMLEDLDNERLARAVAEALEVVDETAEVEFEWKKQKEISTRARQGSVETDNKIDRLLSAIYEIIDHNAELAGESRHRRLARELRDELLPSGVYPITSTKFDRQEMFVDQILERLHTDFTTHVEVLGLEAMVDRLADLNETFAEQLELTDPDRIEFGEVREARNRAREAFHRVVFIIMGDYVDDPETRQRLLEPIELQNERIAQYKKRHGRSPTVDRDSGEPTEP